MHYSTPLKSILLMACFLTSYFLTSPLRAMEPDNHVTAIESSSPIVVSCFYNSCDSWESVCSGDPVWIANLSVDVTDPSYNDEITLSLANAPAGMSISSQSYTIGPNYPDDFNHIYANVDPSLIPGSYTYDIVLTMTDGTSTSYEVTSSFDQEIACEDEAACNYQPFSMCWGNDDCEYPETGFDCDGNALITVECFYNSCTSYEDVCPGSPHWIANLSVDHGDPNYSGPITLSLSGAPAGMTISSQSYDIGPDFPDDFNHIYATIPESVPPGQYTYDIVLTDANGGQVAYEVTTNVSFSTPACTDFSACNYEPGSMCDDWSSCEYPEFGYDCNGNCENDTDGDGVCDEFEVAGCTDANAANYDASATDDDGSCDICYVDPVPSTTAQVLDVFGNGLQVDQTFSTGGSGNYALIEGEVYIISFWYCEDEMMGDELPCDQFDVYPTDENGEQGSYMPTPAAWVGSDIVLYDTYADAVQGANEVFQSTIIDTFGNGLQMAQAVEQLPTYIRINDETFIISMWYCEDPFMGMFEPCHSFDVYPANNQGQQGGYMPTPDSWIGQEVQFFYSFESTQSTYTTPAQIDECGVCGGNGPEEGFDCEGNVLDLVAETPVINAPESNSEHIGGLTIELMLPEMPQDGSVVLTFTQEGDASDEVILNVGQGAHTISFDLNVNVSDLMQVSTSTFGDAPLNAAVYDVQLTYNDLVGNTGSSSLIENISVIAEVPGCTDAEACNFNSEANTDDGSCEYAETHYDCEGNCLNDADDDGVCDELEVEGCTHPDAVNYVAEATDDDGSCIIEGCTYAFAVNYNPEATADDGSCTVDPAATCGEGTYYDEETGQCLPVPLCEGDINGDGEVSALDLLVFLGEFGTLCD
jgi:hypothetical protein